LVWCNKINKFGFMSKIFFPIIINILRINFYWKDGLAFIKQEFYIEKPIKSFLFLIQEFNLTQGESPKFIDKGRLLINGNLYMVKRFNRWVYTKVNYFLRPERQGV